jgi:hypothetical protein
MAFTWVKDRLDNIPISPLGLHALQLLGFIPLPALLLLLLPGILWERKQTGSQAIAGTQPATLSGTAWPRSPRLRAAGCRLLCCLAFCNWDNLLFLLTCPGTHSRIPGLNWLLLPSCLSGQSAQGCWGFGQWGGMVGPHFPGCCPLVIDKMKISRSLPPQHLV